MSTTLCHLLDCVQLLLPGLGVPFQNPTLHFHPLVPAALSRLLDMTALVQLRLALSLVPQGAPSLILPQALLDPAALMGVPRAVATQSPPVNLASTSQSLSMAVP